MENTIFKKIHIGMVVSNRINDMGFTNLCIIAMATKQLIFSSSLMIFNYNFKDLNHFHNNFMHIR